MPRKEEVLEALSQVYDPEVGMVVVDLGLVY
jgi:metal-sulfur cluster biosynthetic enzyme